MRYVSYFYAISRRRVECVVDQWNDFGWPAHEQASSLSFPDRSASNSPTAKWSRAWLAWVGQPTAGTSFDWDFMSFMQLYWAATLLNTSDVLKCRLHLCAELFHRHSCRKLHLPSSRFRWMFRYRFWCCHGCTYSPGSWFCTVSSFR